MNLAPDIDQPAFEVPWLMIDGDKVVLITDCEVTTKAIIGWEKYGKNLTCHKLEEFLIY